MCALDALGRAAPSPTGPPSGKQAWDGLPSALETSPGLLSQAVGDSRSTENASSFSTTAVLSEVTGLHRGHPPNI